MVGHEWETSTGALSLSSVKEPVTAALPLANSSQRVQVRLVSSSVTTSRLKSQDSRVGAAVETVEVVRIEYEGSTKRVSVGWCWPVG